MEEQNSERAEQNEAIRGMCAAFLKENELLLVFGRARFDFYTNCDRKRMGFGYTARSYTMVAPVTISNKAGC